MTFIFNSVNKQGDCRVIGFNRRYNINVLYIYLKLARNLIVVELLDFFVATKNASRPDSSPDVY